VDPGGKYFVKDSELGYANLGGKFTVTVYGPASSYSFTVTHLPDGRRITHPLNSYVTGTKKPELWIFGCSFTHGWTLSDDETYPWLLQQELQDYEVKNYGVDGYSTVQSFIQFREMLSSSVKPAAVMVAYASFHDQRNTLTRNWRKMMVSYGHLAWQDFPYAVLDRNGSLKYNSRPLEYRQFPFMNRSALISLIEEKYDNALEPTYHSQEVSKAVLRDFFEVCKKNDIKFVVAGIYADSATSDMLTYCKSYGMTVTDISVDLNLPGNRMLPYDGHPSPTANKEYARKLGSFLCKGVVQESSCDP
jgi:hypothetical protein